MEELNSSVNNIIEIIKESSEYKKCISLRDKMSKNEELMRLIEEVKSLQKEYIRSNYDSNIKIRLDDAEAELYSIPIYVIYNQELNKVNLKINYIKDILNDYFYKLFNK